MKVCLKCQQSWLLLGRTLLRLSSSADFSLWKRALCSAPDVLPLCRTLPASQSSGPDLTNARSVHSESRWTRELRGGTLLTFFMGGLINKHSLRTQDSKNDWRKLTLTSNTQVVLTVKNPPASAEDVRDAGSIPGLGKSPEEGMATHSSVLAWRIPRTEEPGQWRSIGLQMDPVGHDWSDLAHSTVTPVFPYTHTHTHTLSHTLTHTLTHTHSHSHTHSHTHARTHTLTHTLTHTRTHTHSHTLTHTLTYTLPGRFRITLHKTGKNSDCALMFYLIVAPKQYVRCLTNYKPENSVHLCANFKMTYVNQDYMVRWITNQSFVLQDDSSYHSFKYQTSLAYSKHYFIY